MANPEYHFDESLRLSDLSHYGIVLDEAEESFSDLARLATTITGTPLGGVSVVDDSHVWIKGRAGVDISCLAREGAFCAHAVDSNQDFFCVPDAKADPRFANNPLVVNEPFVRYYAAAPLVSHQGFSLGTLWTMDTKPREPTESDKVSLQALASQVMRLFELRFRNPVSKLPNRSAFISGLQPILSAADDASVADLHTGLVGYIQPQNLHMISSAYGHEVGERAFKALCQVIRDWAGSGIRLAHLEGDSLAFCIIEPLAQAKERLEDLTGRLARLVKVDGSLYRVQCNVGVSHFPRSGCNAASLLAQAATAAISVLDGTDGVRTYESHLADATIEQMAFERDFSQHVKNRRFVAFYQPQVCTKDATLAGLEALMRLDHPTLGIVGPGVILPLAAQAGLLLELDNAVLECVCRDIQSWRTAGLPLVPVAVNRSRSSLLDESSAQTIRSTLAKYGIEPALVEIEVTEAGLTEDSGLLQLRVQELHEIGVAVSIDDFGTGLSNLSTLRAMKFNRLKADRLYVHGASSNYHVGGILRILHNISELFNVELVCEGLEEEADLHWAMQNGCSIFQGWYFCKALDLQATAQMLGDYTLWHEHATSHLPKEFATFLSAFEKPPSGKPA